MRVHINGKRWDLRFTNLQGHGQCDGPHIPNKEIRIRSNLKGEERLDTLIHEMLHAAMWSIDEEVIHAAASDIARVLWRLGYRDGDSHGG